MRLIAQAATMQANGKPLNEIAAALDVKTPSISDWRIRHPTLWDKAHSRAMEANLLLVRELAGTEAVLRDPGESLARARSAERWCKQAGERLLPPAAEMTLCRFYETYYKPNCLAGNRSKSFERYEWVMRAWQLFTGDPPLVQITTETLATFRDAISRLPGRRRLGYTSPNTVRCCLRHLQAVLDKSGPPGRRNRDAAGLLQVVPWIKPPRELINPPRHVSLEDLSAVYIATACMEKPILAGIKPPAWWRLLLVLAFNTGLRRRTLFSLRMGHIDWYQSQLVIPATILKNGRGQVVPLGPTAMHHLLATRTDREFVLPFPRDISDLYPLLYRLQDMAGIPRSRRFGLHAIRRATATVLWGDSPQAAQLMLGHGSMTITQQRYVAAASILRVAADQMPQPEAFISHRENSMTPTTGRNKHTLSIEALGQFRRVAEVGREKGGSTGP
ncbi:MAG TPA: tyrosine-type recombinase/integrase [Pirellulales bacterium]|nr:tyrosine-type recombinase/integrase [Pirellulales bacterium]